MVTQNIWTKQRAAAEHCVVQGGGVYPPYGASLEINYSPPCSLCAAAWHFTMGKLLKWLAMMWSELWFGGVLVHSVNVCLLNSTVYVFKGLWCLSVICVHFISCKWKMYTVLYRIFIGQTSFYCLMLIMHLKLAFSWGSKSLCSAPPSLSSPCFFYCLLHAATFCTNLWTLSSWYRH